MEQNTHETNLGMNESRDGGRPGIFEGSLVRMSSQVILSVRQAPYREEISQELPRWGQSSLWTYLFLQKHVVFYIRRLRCIETEEEARLRPGLDTCPLQDTHPIHQHLKTGKPPCRDGRNMKTQHPSQNSDPEISLICGCCANRRSAGSTILQDCLQEKKERLKFRHQRQTLVRNCSSPLLTDFQQPFGIWLYTYVKKKKNLLWP